MNTFGFFLMALITEAALHRCSYEKVFWKYVANLQEKTIAEMRFQ